MRKGVGQANKPQVVSVGQLLQEEEQKGNEKRPKRKGINAVMRKSMVLGIICLLIVTVTLGISAEEIKWEPAPKTIDIGTANAFTGSQALSGEIMKRGHEVAVERVNAEGGIMGIPIRMVYEDTKGTNEGAVAALNKLIYDRKVPVTFATDYSSLNHAVSPIIERAEIPAVYGGSAWSVRLLKNPWMFGIRTNDKANAGIMAKFIVEDLGQTKIAALYADEAFGQGGFDETSRVLKEDYGITLLSEQKFARGTKDYTAQLLAIKESGATCIFSWCPNPEDDGIILRQVKQLGLDVTFVGGSSYGSLAICVKIAGADAEGVYAVVDYTPIAEGDGVKYLNDRIMKKYGEPADSDMQWPYDGTLVVAEALRRSGIIREIDGKKMMMPLKEARKAIREALLSITEFSEGTTKPYGIDENQDFAHSMFIVRIKDQQHEYITSVEYR